MEPFRNFIIDHVDRVLEYLKQNPLLIYARRSVDAYAASYALAQSFGETTHVAVVDWPPQRGVCVGFKCDGFYITEWEVGIDDKTYKTEFTSISHLTAVLIQALAPLEEDVHKVLYVGHYAWSVDYCEFKCPLPPELAKGDEVLRIVSPHLDDLPFKKALSLSTLPIVPGVTGKMIEDGKPASELTKDDAVALLDWALGVAAAEGFHTAVLDKAVRPYSKEFKPAEKAQRVEADLAGFLGRDLWEYVSNIAEAFYQLLKKKEEVIALSNPFYVYKLPPYLAYYIKNTQWYALRYDSPRGHLVAVVPPPGAKDRLKTVEERLAEVGPVLKFPTHVVVFVESDKWHEFKEAYEKARS
ncbi:MAG: hypothetical protein ABWK05_06270 [Pyrobaculum sp.]